MIPTKPTLFHPSSLHPATFVVRLVQTAYDDPSVGTGMNKASVFQVDAYVGGTSLVTPIVEKDEVAFAQLGFAHLAAILGALVVGASF